MSNLDPRWHALRLGFGVELEERVQALNRLLLGLERDAGVEQSRREVFELLFREAHSLKGAAHAVGFGAIEQLAHAIETALAGVRQQPTAADSGWVDALYRAIDLFGPLYQAALSGLAPPPELNDVLSALQRVDAASIVSSETEPLPMARSSSSELPREHLPQHPAVPAQSQAAPVAADVATRSSESVRVAIHKLDTLLTQAGELAVTHIRIERRYGELKDLRQEFNASWRRHRRIRRALGTHIRQALTALGAEHSELVRDSTGLADIAEQADHQLETLLQQVEQISSRLRDDLAVLGLVSQSIEDEVIAVRLMPVSALFAPFERMVRDLARDHGKQIRLVIEGAETEIDRKILEQVRDPLMHMLRNAVDHGIEAPEQREAQRKPRTGTIRLAATQRSGIVEIELEDDGSGIDPVRLRESAITKGLLSSEQAAMLDDQAALDLIFRPGFSTNPTVTGTSGRGVGMDIVRTNVEHLDGKVFLVSLPGRGTRFTLSLPLTLATTRALLVEQGGTLYAIPTAMIERTSRVQEQHLWTVEGRRTLRLDGSTVPVVELSDVLELLPKDPSLHMQEQTWRPIVILRQNGQRLAFLTGRLVGEQELMIKRLGWPLRRVRNVGGMAILGSGETTVILNPADLFKTGLKLIGAGPYLPSPSLPGRTHRRQCVLIADDSLTTRTLERSILESAGYDTAVAGDGIEALKVLCSQSIDLVVSDVNMPHLDGFGLTAEIRRDEKLRRIPVILVTSLDAREHRERGAAVGADAYIVKADFDQNLLLETIGRLL